MTIAVDDKTHLYTIQEALKDVESNPKHIAKHFNSQRIAAS